MKETPLSNCERRFLLRAIEEKKVSGPGALGLLGSPGPRQSSGFDTALVLAGPGSPWGDSGASLVPQALVGYSGFFARAPRFYFLGRRRRIPLPSKCFARAPAQSSCPVSVEGISRCILFPAPGWQTNLRL